MQRTQLISICVLAIADMSVLTLLTDRVHHINLIPCKAQVEKGVLYRKISWYMVTEGSEELTGLVMKDLLKNSSVIYKFANHSYEVREDLSLFLPETAEKDCGRYRCTLWAPLGYRIQEGDYEYYPPGCDKPTKSLQSMPKFSEQAMTIKRDYLSNWVIVTAVAGGVILAVCGLTIICICLRRENYKKVPV